jgi:hypothetical protein
MSPFGFSNCSDPILDDQDLLNQGGCYECGALGDTNLEQLIEFAHGGCDSCEEG